MSAATGVRQEIEELLAAQEDLGRKFDSIQRECTVSGEPSLLAVQDLLLEEIRGNSHRLRLLVEGGR